MNQDGHKLLIYGANGMSGEVLVRHAIKQQLRPVLGGRNQAALKKLAEEFDLEVRVSGLDDPSALDKMLEDVRVVMNFAGPPDKTVVPLVEAALRNGTHYLDIAGDCEYIYSLDRFARENGVVLCPMVGIDAAPSDLLAVRLKELLPDANQLEIGLAINYYSAGSTVTMLELLRNRGVHIRVNGVIRRVPFGSRRLHFDGPGGPYHGLVVPLLDPYTSWRSSGIPNIAAYTASPRFGAVAAWILRRIQGLLEYPDVFSFITRHVYTMLERLSAGESTGKSDLVYARLSNKQGKFVEGWIQCPGGGYSATADFALVFAQHLLANTVKGGAYAPGELVPFNALLAIEGLHVSENLRRSDHTADAGNV